MGRPVSTLVGSSPLSRGIPTRRGSYSPRSGIIPALAGNTRPSGQLLLSAPDHPRSRGEYPTPTSKIPGVVGSSPLSRGIRLGFGAVGDPVRIIPALAGNTRSPGTGMSSRRDHPRSRGEYAIPPCWLAHPDGSSPLSRGIQLILVTPQINERIIPALAGNTRGLPAPPEPHQDHPRSRGEYVWVARTDMPPLGSSPLSRGIRRSVPAWLDVHGIIPALAGNTTGSLPPSFSPEDHPRSRGEY